MMMILKILISLILIVGCSIVEIDIAVTSNGNPISHEEDNDTGIE